jgi:hypothetical protein
MALNFAKSREIAIIRTEKGPSPLLIYKDWESIRAHGISHVPEKIEKLR